MKILQLGPMNNTKVVECPTGHLSPGILDLMWSSNQMEDVRSGHNTVWFKLWTSMHNLFLSLLMYKMLLYSH